MGSNSTVSGRKIFITGGAGFIASHLIERIIEQNTVVVYDSFKRNALKYTPFESHPNLTIIEGDVLDAPALAEAMQGADVCVHAAAVAGIYSVSEFAARTMRVNFIGTANALEAAKANGVSRFVDFSTSEVYGPFVFRGKETDATSLGPVGERRWVYAASKLAAEHYAHSFAEEAGFDIVILRPFNVYGPRQIGEGAIQRMAGLALKDEPITVYNDGTQIRSWCFAEDFAGALHAALHVPEAANQVFNIGNPQATITVLGLAQQIIRMTESRSEIRFEAHPGPEVELRVPEIDNARERLRFEPEIGLEEGLRQTIAWYQGNPVL